jgi:hypothetical protein
MKEGNNPVCSLIGRQLLKRLVSEKHHFPFSLRMLRTTLTVCRAQSMSFHLKPKYSLGRIPVVSATASTSPYSVPSAALSNTLASSRVRDRISFRTCCGTLSPSAGSQATSATARPAASHFHQYMRVTDSASGQASFGHMLIHRLKI